MLYFRDWQFPTCFLPARSVKLRLTHLLVLISFVEHTDGSSIHRVVSHCWMFHLDDMPLPYDVYTLLCPLLECDNCIGYALLNPIKPLSLPSSRPVCSAVFFAYHNADKEEAFRGR